jgi:hypothetical protein
LFDGGDNFGVAADIAVHTSADRRHRRQFECVEPYDRKATAAARFGRWRPDAALGGKSIERRCVKIAEQTDEVAQRLVEILDYDEAPIDTLCIELG